MGCAGAIRSHFNSYLASDRYLTSGRNDFFTKANYWGGIWDDVGKLGQHSAGLAQQISLMVGNNQAAATAHTISEAFGESRDIVGAVRFIPLTHKLFTGQMFWQVDKKNGWRRVACNRVTGEPEPIPREKLNSVWIKQKEGPDKGSWSDGTNLSRDGKYIEDPKNGIYIARSWTDIAMDILTFVARILAPVRYLHGKGAYDLGPHAGRMGSVATGCWAGVVSINFVTSIHGLIDEVDTHSIRKKSWEAVQSGLDLAAIPFDFGIGKAHPALAAVGAAINVLSAGSCLVKEFVDP